MNISSSGSGLLVALLLVPVLGALVVAFLKDNDQLAKRVALVFGLVEFVLAIVAWVAYEPTGARLQQHFSVDWIPTFGVHISFGVDGIALVMVATIALLVPLLIGASWTDKLPEGRSVGGFLALILVEEALTIGVFAATDVFLFYVLFEIMLIPMYFLIGSYGGARRQYAAVKFFLYSFLGGLIMLASAIGCYSMASNELGQGTFDWPSLVQVVHDAPLGTQIWLFLGFFTAFAVKAPLVPFHTWLPDAHVEAPTAGSIILAGVLLKLGGYGFLRYSLPLLPDASKSFAPIVIGLAVIAVLYGAMVSMVQPDLKKLIAYSSVSHMGFVMLGVFVFNTQGLQGAVFQMISHGVTTGALFLLVGVIYERTHDRQIAHMGGLNGRLPRYAAIFGLFTFASIGLPGLSGFIGEFLVVLGSFQYSGWVAAATMLVVIISAVYMLWMFQRVFFAVPSDWMRRAWPTLNDMTRNEWLALTPLILLVVGMGVLPGPILDAISAPVQRILDAVNASPGLTSFRLPW